MSYNDQNPYGGQPQNPYGEPSQNPYGGQPQSPYGNYNQNQNQYYQDAGNVSQYSQPQYSQPQYNQYDPNPYVQQRSGFAQNAGMVGAAMINDVLTSSFVFMFIALLVTGITALIVASSDLLYNSLYNGTFKMLFLISFIVEIALVIACQAVMKKNNAVLSGILFFAFAVANGIMFSVVFLAFQLSSIVTVFFMTSVVFGVMALYGGLTKRDLTGWGPILFAGLIGILVGSLINIFLGSSTADFVVTIIGIVVFTLYTAYDVNKIKRISRMNTGLSVTVLGMYGAMELYLDFINLFLKLLRLMGKRK